MSWTHSSKAVAAGVLLVVALGAAGPVAGISFDGQSPESTQVGEEVEMEVVIEDPFQPDTELPDQWTLEGETELGNASWTITAEDNAGEVVQRSDTNEIDLDSEQGITAVRITLRGDVPEMSSEDFNYEQRSEENYTAMEVLRQTSNGTQRVGSEDEALFTAHRYTEKSQEARQAIEEASDAGASGEDYQRAIDLYDNGEFDTAISLAEDAQGSAESEEQTQTLLLFGGAAVLLLVLAGGGYYVYQQQSRDTNKLQ